MAEIRALPSMRSENRVRVVHWPCQGKTGQLVLADDLDRLHSAGSAGSRRAAVGVIGRVHPNPEFGSIGVAQEATQKRFTRDIAAISLGPPIV